MSRQPSRRAVVAGALAAAALTPALAAEAAGANLMQTVLDYAQSQQTTGFLVQQDRRVLAERNWPAPAGAPQFHNFAYGTNAAGELLEDVASQQKSFVAVLAAIAVDKGLLDIEKPVSEYLGSGWSKASADEERQIRVIHLLTMCSGLTVGFAYAAPPATTFLYNTPVYATLKRVLAAAAQLPLEALTHDWLTAPAGMADTAWRQRPAAFAEVGNPSGLVTSPRDTAKFGQLILDEGLAADGRRVVSEAGIAAMFERSPANPAYGRLWWLNGGAWMIRPPHEHASGELIPTAPADLVAALGALDRKLYVVPSLKLVVVRLGAATPDKDFDTQLWKRLQSALGGW